MKIHPTKSERTNKLLKLLVTDWLPNLVLVVGLVVLIHFNLPLLAFALVGLSKWQILRGGRKIWLRNIRDNACDLVAATSSVMLLILFAEDLALQIATAWFYYVWLILIKPLKGHIGVAIQGGVTQFLGLMVIFMMARDLPMLLVIALSWGVGLIVADHLISAFHERAHFVLSLVWAFLVAEAAWLFWNWLIVYSLFDGRLQIPQPALVVSLLGYIFGNMYIDHMQTKLGKRRLIEYVLLIIGLSVILIFGSQWDTRL